ncbi:unnamed protein product [Merluccius merluccius]
MPQETTGRRPGILCHLAPLAGLTPASHVGGHPWPVTPLPEQFQGLIHPLVTMVLVYLSEDFLFQSSRQQYLENCFPTVGAQDLPVCHSSPFSRSHCLRSTRASWDNCLRSSRLGYRFCRQNAKTSEITRSAC